MPCFSLGLIISLVILIGSPIYLSAQDENPSRSLIKKYCLGCHNNNLLTAGFSLEDLDPTNIGSDAAVWEKVLRKVTLREMPPTGFPAPKTLESLKLVTQLEEALDAASAAFPNPGRPAPHRLNRVEYSNAIRDLLSIDINAESMLPADDSGYGFDNIANVLSLSPTLLERYLLAARRISRWATGNPNIKPQKDYYERNRESGFLRAGHKKNSRQDLPFGADQGTALHYYFPADGEYIISFGVKVDGFFDREEYQSEQLKFQVESGLHTLGFTFLGESSRNERFSPLQDTPFELIQRPFDIRLDGKRLKLFNFPSGPKRYVLEWISIDGPYNVVNPVDISNAPKLFPCFPVTKSEERPCAEKILSSLTRRAYRGPVDEVEFRALLKVYESGLAKGGFRRGIEKSLQAILVSPNFLFRLEKDPPEIKPGIPYRISDIELASRLSFFLWSSIPDEELLSLAEKKHLHDPLVLKNQVQRMLADRRSSALVENFAGQWLYLRNINTVKPNKVLFPEFSAELRVAAEQETKLFFEKILRENRSVFELLDSDYTFLNNVLAKHYGIGNINGPQFREIKLPDYRRGGLLGQASILTVTSYPTRTSVTSRGKWILENLFGMPPPPPPPDIPELEKESHDTKKRLTLREAMSLHRNSPTCSSCHVRMDPIGFALENYDAIGRWRTEDAGAPINAWGELPGEITFDGPGELKQVLTTNFGDAFVATVIEKLLAYGLGRGVDFYDKSTVRSIVRETATKKHRLKDLILAIVKSTPFQMRRSASP